MKILFFSPNSAIWVHEKPELEYARELIQLGHDVSFLRCNTHFRENCISFSAFGLGFDSLPAQKIAVCTRCVRTSKYIDKVSDFQSDYIGDLNAFEIEILEQLEKIDRFNWWDYEIDGINLGRFAAYEFVLHHKLNARVIPEEHFPEYISGLRYSLGVYFFAKNYFASNNFDAVVLYNRLYSLNKIFCEVAKQYGIESYTLHASGNILDFYGRTSIFKNDLAAFTVNRSRAWSDHSKLKLNRSEIEGVVDHFRGLFEAKSPWVYSTKPKRLDPNHLKAIIGIPPTSKVVLLATSSVDEVFAMKMIGVDPRNSSNDNLFDSQLNWVESVCKFISEQEDIFLIVRIHPREFANKREGVNSSNGSLLSGVIESHRSANIYPNLPEDEFSLYDLVAITDLLLAGNSSAVPEFTVLGIPCLSHDTEYLTAYPQDLSCWAQSIEAYFEKLKLMIHQPLDKNKQILAFRWFNFKFNTLGEVPKVSRSIRHRFIFGSLRRVFVKLGFFPPRFLKILWRKNSFAKKRIHFKSKIEMVLSDQLEGFFELPRGNVGDLDEIDLIFSASSRLTDTLTGLDSR